MEDPGLPGPVPHPGLVRQAFADDDGSPWVEVVYGTSVDPNRFGNQYFTVSKVSEMDACNLKFATRFCFDRCMQLPWAEEYFQPLPKAPTPIMGHLSLYGVQILQIQMAYYQRDVEKRAESSSVPDA